MSDRVISWADGRMMHDLLKERNFWKCFTLAMYDAVNAPIIEVADPNRLDMENDIARWREMCLRRRNEISQMIENGTKINDKYLDLINAYEALMRDI